jgi:hypothetical protein
MKKIAIALLFIASLAHAQYVPRPVGGFVYNGSAWVALTSSSSSGALSYTPNGVALYAFNGTAWVPCTPTTCGGGGGGGGLPTATGIGQVPVATGAGTTYTAQFPDATKVPVEYFGAVGDYSGSGSGGTDDTTAINSCLSAFSSTLPGNCWLGPRKYKISGTLTVNHSAVGLLGTTYGAISNAISNQLAASVPAASLWMTSATADIVDVWGASISAPLSFNQFRDFTMMRTTAPTVTSSGGCGSSGNLGPSGLSIKYNGGAQISNVWSEDSACGFYFLNAGAFGTGYVENSGALWGFNGFNFGIPVYGYFVDGSQSAESLRIRHSFAETNNFSGVQSVGLLVNGSDQNDIFVDNLETAFVTFGDYLQATGSCSSPEHSDVHLINTVNDTFFNTGITVSGFTEACGGSVEISGGWQSQSGNGSGINVTGSSGVTIANVHFLNNGSMQNGITATNASRLAITGNDFLGMGAADIALSTVTDSTVTGNVMNSVSSQSTTAMVSCVSCTRMAFTGNSLGGYATTGISMDSGSSNNIFTGVSAIDPAHITTQVSNLGANNTFDGVGGLIAKLTGAGTPASITFSSIPQTYTNLKLLGNFLITSGANLAITFNGDSTAAHYAYGLGFLNNGTPGGTQSQSSTHALIGASGGAVSVEIPSYTAGIAGGVNFTDSFSTMAIGSESLTGYGGGLWNGTDVTSLTLADSGGSALFTAGSVFSLYGLN